MLFIAARSFRFSSWPRILNTLFRCSLIRWSRLPSTSFIFFMNFSCCSCRFVFSFCILSRLAAKIPFINRTAWKWKLKKIVTNYSRISLVCTRESINLLSLCWASHNPTSLIGPQEYAFDLLGAVKLCHLSSSC